MTSSSSSFFSRGNNSINHRHRPLCYCGLLYLVLGVAVPIASAFQTTSSSSFAAGGTCTPLSTGSGAVAGNSRGIGGSSSISSSIIGSNAILLMSSSSSSSSPSPSGIETPAVPRGTRGPNYLTLPKPIVSTVPGTWAHDTMSRRVDEEIMERTHRDNRIALNGPGWEDALRRFEELRSELRDAAHTKITYLPETNGRNGEGDGVDVDVDECVVWNQDILRPHVERGETWLSAPWMVTEFYLYRRLMDCFKYFDQDSPSYKYDPFHEQKRAGLLTSVSSSESALGKLLQLTTENADTIDAGVGIATSISLWGNKMDLSLWPADLTAGGRQQSDAFSTLLRTAHENLLCDDTSDLVEHCRSLKAGGGGNVDIVVDNAGFELVTDLALGQYLVASGIARTVTFQLKSHPTFVSDAMEKDLLETAEYYRADIDAGRYPNARRCGQIWRDYLDGGQFRCNEHPFWTQGLPMWKMPSSLYDDIRGRCQLTFVKGDANYRRLLGDLHWGYVKGGEGGGTNFQDVVACYFPSPVCALRTLKAELGCGMDDDAVERARNTDPETWMVNGKYGVVQFGKPGDD